MRPTLVADVGNSRIKWGRCAPDGPVEHTAALPDDPGAWEQLLAAWELGGPHDWAVSGVAPARRDALVEWLRGRGNRVLVIDSWRQLQIEVRVDHPDQVGIDRLLNAVAAKSRVRRAVPVVVIDAGSAVTVNWIDADGAFRGGAIFPGLRLMARALHDYTAKLPLLEDMCSHPYFAMHEWTNPPVPGTSTRAAIRAGIFWAVTGGIKALVRVGALMHAGGKHHIFLTGGDAAVLAPMLDPDYEVWPEMTLEGVRLAAEALP